MLRRTIIMKSFMKTFVNKYSYLTTTSFFKEIITNNNISFSYIALILLFFSEALNFSILSFAKITFSGKILVNLPALLRRFTASSGRIAFAISRPLVLLSLSIIDLTRSVVLVVTFPLRGVLVAFLLLVLPHHLQ